MKSFWHNTQHHQIRTIFNYFKLTYQFAHTNGIFMAIYKNSLVGHSFCFQAMSYSMPQASQTSYGPPISSTTRHVSDFQWTSVAVALQICPILFHKSITYTKMPEDEHFLGTKIFPYRASLQSSWLSSGCLKVTEFDLLGLNLILYITIFPLTCQWPFHI